MDTLLTDCNCVTALMLESSGIFVAIVMDIQSRIDEYIKRRQDGRRNREKNFNSADHVFIFLSSCCPWDDMF